MVIYSVAKLSVPVYSSNLFPLYKQTGDVLKITDSICWPLLLNMFHDSKMKGIQKGFKLFANYSFSQRDFYFSLIRLNRNKRTHTQ